MSNRGQILIGIFLLFFGLLLLGGEIFNINMGEICWPLALILLGVLLLARPWLEKPGSGTTIRPLGDVRRRGEWQVTAEEIWMFVGDVRLDMTQAVIPTGETVIRIYSFVGDVELGVPPGVGVSLASTAFLTDSKLLGEKKEHFFGTLERASSGYELAERKIRLELIGLVIELKVAYGS